MISDNRTNEHGRCWYDHPENNHYGGESCRVFGCSCPRFALFAAANTAPQAPYSDPVMTAPQAESDVQIHEQARRVIEAAMREAWSDAGEYENLPEIAATRVVERFNLAAPVLPSSTVDDALPRAEREGRCPYSHQMDRCAKCGWQRSPALPPVPVDEDALPEVIAHAESDWQFKFDQFRSETGVDPGPKAEYVARAVAEWLKEQGK